MPSKRKREEFYFDPNQSDPEDENFEPGEDKPARTKKRARPSSGKKSKSKRSNRYRGSDIEDDDDDVSDSLEDEFSEVDADDGEEDEDLPVNAAGRTTRRAAAKPVKYEESDDEEVEEEEEEIADSDNLPEPADRAKTNRRRKTTELDEDEAEAVEDDDEDPARPASKVIKLKITRSGLKSALAFSNNHRRTRSQTEEAEDELVELSNSGKHARPSSRASRSKSPEAFVRRSSRAVKSLKKPPETIEEATQESSGPLFLSEADELAGAMPVDEPANMVEDAEMSDGAAAAAAEDAEEGVAHVDEAGDVGAALDNDDDDDDVPIPRGRTTRASRSAAAAATASGIDDIAIADQDDEKKPGRRLTRGSALKKSKSVQEPSSDFDPGEDSPDEGNMSDDASSKPADQDDLDFESPTPRGRRASKPKARSAKSSRRRRTNSDDEMELDKDEMADELEDLREDSRSRARRNRRRPSPEIIYQEVSKRRRAAASKPINYFMPPVTGYNVEEEDAAEDPAPTPARRRGGRGGASQAWDRQLNTTFGPFGGGGAGSLLGGPWGTGAAGGVDSDSSDDEMGQRSGAAGNVGMTPTSGAPQGLLPGLAQPHGELGGIGATPNVGKIKSQKALADVDPLGVDMTVDFNHVGGLQGHIDQLKEMVQLPLLYPELFQKFHVTPPRGVLFHGPPGTGKTLLARALANSVGIGGRKITFYMRKGADALSKWVGEAEKQLRLLFEEARRTQPSIIFFDEIDGLAPVRSSKQEQIHASIVSTLLASMDGMDGRGQVIVIGATNRPDNIDPALRRPGRFDREFYFPLPDVEGRRSILEIYTKDWGLSTEFKQSLADRTKGYGGADLRALCTEAALNSIQRTYPQIYAAKEKLVVDADKISVSAADFMISIKKLVPSSERSAGSGAASLPKAIEPLLRDQFADIKKALDELMPRKKKITALEEAMFEPFEDEDHGFGRETLYQEFERSRVFRPRFLISGLVGMGQSYLSSALLHYFEGVQVQNFGLPNLLADGRPMEQVIVSLFTEVKRHKPSVVYIPSIESWYETLRDSVAFVTFKAMLKSISPTDPILVLATAEYEDEDDIGAGLLKELFGFSRKNRIEIARPKRDNRREYFNSIVEYIRKSPDEFPDPVNRKKRILEELPVAPPPPPKVPSKDEVRAMQKRDRQLLNILKVQLQPIMDQINRKYKKFRQPVIAPHLLDHLFLESDPNYIRPDLAEAEVGTRPFEIVKDKHGHDVLRETATGKTFYNLETTTIEERLSNGFYARPDDFLRDIKALAKDAKNIGDKERTLKANELVSNVEVDVATIAANTANVDWEGLHLRQAQRAKAAGEKERKRKAMQSIVDRMQSDAAAAAGDSDSQGPVTLGEPIPGSHTHTRFQPMSPRSNGLLGMGAMSGAGLGLSPSQPLSNGNGNGLPKPEKEGDVQMSGVDDDTQPVSEAAMGPPSQWPGNESRSGVPSAQATAGTTQLSQRSAITSLPAGVSPSAVANDASTTKTSDPSEQTSSKWSTQVTNGYHPNHSTGGEPNTQNTQNDNSQLQDTQIPGGVPASQATSSDEPWPHSQADGLARGAIRPPSSVPVSSSSALGTGSGTGAGTGSRTSGSNDSVKPTPNISSIINASPTDELTRYSGSSLSQQHVVLQEQEVSSFLETLTNQTSGCTIEQLEQINRELMDELWRTRAEWNRMKVLGDCTAVFNETIRDIEQIQGMLQQSQEWGASRKQGGRA